jgi:glutamine amidotransferase
MTQHIVVIDYGMGNLRSVEKAFERAGARVKVSSRIKDVKRADKVVLPGVGAFGHAMRELKARDLVEPILEKIDEGVPYLGLCLGLQLLFGSSEEAREKGLGVLPGKVRRFSAKGGPAGTLKVPHMGWNQLATTQNNNPLLKGSKADAFFYFVHSYYAVPKDKSVVAATTDYGVRFCSAIWKDNIFATQFHPEKSQNAGQVLLQNFVRI